MGGDAEKKVLVLTERPDDYSRDLGRMGLKLEFASKVSALLDKLMEEPTCGFVLEIDRVMRAKRAERDHLLKVAGAFPMLRTVRRGEDYTLAYLDDPVCFAKNAKGFSPRRMRCQTRVPVRLNVLLAGEDDPGFDQAVRANMLDVSASGGFIYSLDDFSGQEMVGLRILELADQARILAHVRWRRPWGLADCLPGIGLLFVDIRPGQLSELMSRYLSQPEAPDPLKVAP